MRHPTRFALAVILLTSILASSAEPASRDIGVAPRGAPSQQVEVRGDYWALIVGIDKYQYAPPLESAVRDAEGVGEVLIERYGFQPDRITMLLNEEATRTNIEDALYQFGRRAGVEDSVLIYYAGHGQFEEEGSLGWWVPVDGHPKKPGTFVTNASIRDYIKGMKARHVYLVADSCFSGTLFGTRALPPITDQWYSRLYAKRSRWGLTSGGTEPVADKGKEGHSLFAYHFIHLLKENTTPYLVPTRIYDQLAPVIANNADQTPRSEPLRGAGDEGGQFVFRLASAVPHPGPAGSGPGGGSVEEVAQLRAEVEALKTQLGQPRSEPAESIQEPRVHPATGPDRQEGDVWVTADGAVPLTDEASVGELKTRSREDARRRALEAAVETFLQGQAPARHAKVARDLVQSVVRGIVVKEEVLREGPRLVPLGTGSTSPMYTTSLKALVKPVRAQAKSKGKEGLAVTATLNKEVFREGEEMVITAATTKDAYLHIFNIGQDDEVTALLPNRFSQQNFVEAQKGLVFPDETLRERGIHLRVYLPPKASSSSEKIKLIVTTKNADLIKGRIREGIYQVYSGKDKTFVADLLKELSLLEESEWAEVTVSYDARKQ